MTLPLNILRALLVGGVAAFLLSQAVSAQARDSFWTEERMQAAIPAEELVDPRAVPPTGAPRQGEVGAPSYVPAVRPGDASTARLRSGSPPPAATPSPARLVRDLVADPAAAGVRTHGKIFFSIGGNGSEPRLYVCSGTVVASKIQSVVLTAGHCVFDAQGSERFMENWIFVPAYQQDQRPFGVWRARSLATTKEWRRDDNIRYDVGVAVLARNGQGQRIQEVVGARGIAFNQSRNQQYRVFGYPHTDPLGGQFDGNKEYVCTSPMTRRDSPLGGIGPRTTQIRCDMTAGASGGGWIVGRTLHGLTSYGYDSEPQHLYGPYLSNTAKSLYAAVRSGLTRKSRRKVAATAARARTQR